MLGATTNLLTNPSFETGTTIATGWADEHTTVSAATYSLPATGVFDGSKAQKFTYTGQAGDDGITAKTEIYQAPITAVAGDVLTFSVYLSGSFTNAYALIGIEAFDVSSVYISETDANVTTLTGTPTRYDVTYVCPAGTSYVAAYLLCPAIGPTSVLSVTMDSARLVKSLASTKYGLLLGVG